MSFRGMEMQGAELRCPALCTPAAWVLETSRDGDSTAFLGSLCQRPTTLSAKNFCRSSHRNLPWHNSRPLPLVLALAMTPLPATLPPLGYLWRAARPPRASSPDWLPSNGSPRALPPNTPHLLRRLPDSTAPLEARPPPGAAGPPPRGSRGRLRPPGPGLPLPAAGGGGACGSGAGRAAAELLGCCARQPPAAPSRSAFRRQHGRLCFQPAGRQQVRLHPR